jgi:hypothetical protein
MAVRSLTDAVMSGLAWLQWPMSGGGCIVAVGDASMVALMVLSRLLADFPTSSFAALEGT